MSQPDYFTKYANLSFSRDDGESLGEIFKPTVWEKTRVEGAKALQQA